MMTTLYSVFQLDGEDYVADITMTLLSNPPQYNAYRLSDRKHRFVFCSQVSCDRYMYPNDFYKFLYEIHPVTVTGTMRGEVTSTNMPPHVVVHQREKTPIELLEARVEKLEKLIKKTT